MILKSFSLLVCLFSILASFGQRELSAKDAVYLALENNYQIQIAEKQSEISEKNNRWSQAGLFPTVTLSVAQNNTIQDNTKNPFTFTPGIILSNSINPSLSANWNIFSGFSVLITKEQLEQLEAQSANNALSVIEETIQDVLKAYYAAQLQKERLTLFGSILDLSRERYAYYALKEKYSTANSLELFQFRNQLLTDSTNYLLQEISYQNALRNLHLLMNEERGENETVDYLLTDALDLPLQLMDFSQAEAEMLSNNNNLKNQYIALELQKTATSLQRSFLYPTLSFQAGVQPGWSWLRDLNSSNLNINTQTLSYYGNFNLRYNLFNNWKAKRAVEVGQIQEEIASLGIDQMKQSLSSTLQNLIAMYDARSKLVEISSENKVYAQKAFDLAKKRFDLGTINSIDLASFQNNYQNTMVQHYENLFNRMDTYLEIYKMTGKLGLEYEK